jgi:hypothetical protein
MGLLDVLFPFVVGGSLAAAVVAWLIPPQKRQKQEDRLL